MNQSPDSNQNLRYSSPIKRPKKRLNSSKPKARKIHKFLAYLVGFSLFWLSITGILLNHSDDLNLNKNQVTQHWLLNWYNITPPIIEKAYPIPSQQMAQHWLIATPTQRFWNDSPIKHLDQHGHLRHLLQTYDLLILVQDKSLALLTQEGELVDTLDTPATLEILLQQNTPIEFYLNDEQQLLISTAKTTKNKAKNHQAWWISDDFSELKAIETPDISHWTALTAKHNQTPPTHLKLAVQKQFTSNLTLEKVILELHNGYFFGKAGSWILDILTLLFLVMVITGLRLSLKK